MSSKRSRKRRSFRAIVVAGQAALLLATGAVLLAVGVFGGPAKSPSHLAASTGGVTYGLRPGFPRSWDTTNFTPPEHDATFTTVGVGDLVVVYFHTYAITSHVESVQDSNNRIAWHSSASVVDTYATFTERLEMWIGTVTSVGSTTITDTWSGGSTDLFVYAWEFSSSAGSSVSS